ncbi:MULTISPECIES: hypothetical protein [unclassified Pseudoclavibacter]|uniref:hypothetical protein n=1 Tax=unclassified Pseudoclavibacter TaxID=2615177 RepID=UPI001BAC8126|nr:hypothetical protein [Pseudoclavibacter sp. Marseille-Q4354]MBS3177721.1 hypothetical protein [Pseudoclavibacter sp. Marseille-Q4354]
MSDQKTDHEVAADALELAAWHLGDTELDTVWEAIAWLNGQASAVRATGAFAEDGVEALPASAEQIERAARAMYDENRSTYLNRDQHDAEWTGPVRDAYVRLAIAGLAAVGRVQHV